MVSIYSTGYYLSSVMKLSHSYGTFTNIVITFILLPGANLYCLFPEDSDVR